MGNAQERSLYHAARNGDEEAILEAIKQGANVNIDTKTPHNPVRLASLAPADYLADCSTDGVHCT